MYVSCPFKVKTIPKIQNQRTHITDKIFLEGQLVSVVWYLKLQYKHTCIKVFIAVKLAANVRILLQFD